MSLGLTLTYKLGECGISCLALFSVMVLYMIDGEGEREARCDEQKTLSFTLTHVGTLLWARSPSPISHLPLPNSELPPPTSHHSRVQQPNSTSCPNIPFFISINISVCLLVYCIFVRGISLAARMKINEALLGRFKDHAAAAVLVPSSSALDMATGIPDALLPPPRGSASTKESGGSDKEKGKVFWSFLIRYREYLTEKCMLQLTAVFLVVLIIPVLAIFFTIGNASCRPNPAFGPDYTIIKIAFISFFIGGPVLLYFIRNVQDGHDIRQDLVISICINIPLYIAFVGWYTFDALIEFTDSGWWAPPNFVMMAVFVAHTLAVTKPLAKVIKEDLRSRSGQVDLEMNHDSFGRLIERKDAKLWISFKEYAVREFCVENVVIIVSSFAPVLENSEFDPE
ncbi:hypothetical protein M427DRAFT_71912 [Gonapodya prolifera JEL478]|uniref:RGS domain-containing protein n=1 Tax=Gonapodya prolifera (strain JEL478) TaxID=1344416 RepID=A0A139A7E4_GONPJ|nr:hypothetical protein M427DRAFT_71912 [Gonapodya prolifera JEL478]|eukprot:KXS12609.1 hypothetical protein M427DRAFT_71912 [Gonapodya prolifera JEL478]